MLKESNVQITEMNEELKQKDIIIGKLTKGGLSTPDIDLSGALSEVNDG